MISSLNIFHSLITLLTRLNFSYLQPRKPDVAYMQHCPKRSGAPKNFIKKFISYTLTHTSLNLTENNFRKPRSDLGLDRVNPALDSAPARITAPNGTAAISAAVGPASRRYRSTHSTAARRAQHAGSAALSAYVGIWTQTCIEPAGCWKTGATKHESNTRVTDLRRIMYNRQISVKFRHSSSAPQTVIVLSIRSNETRKWVR